MTNANPSGRRLVRRLERLEAIPASPTALLAEMGRIDALVQAGGEPPPVSTRSKLTQAAIGFLAAVAAIDALMPGGSDQGVAETEAT